MTRVTPSVSSASTRWRVGWLRCAVVISALLAPVVVHAGPPILPPPPGASVPAPAQPVETADTDAPQVQRPRARVHETDSTPAVLEPTSSPAPPSRLPKPAARREPAPKRPELVATSQETEPEPKQRIAHRGFILDAAAGTLGCTRAICAGRGGYDAAPGVFASGFIGGNIGGFVELGIKGGWGRMRSRAESGEHAVSYWGVAPGELEHELRTHSEAVGSATVDTLAHARSHDIALSAFHAAPVLRIHFAPRGRAIVFAGAGAGYGGLRSDHRTDRGPLHLSAHGLAVPIEGGLGVHITPHLAVVARFDYLWMHYLLLAIDDRSDTMILPTSMMDKLTGTRQGSTQASLPHFWTVSLGLRLRLF